MFKLLRRLATKSGTGKAAVRQARPRLEVLEGREVPATLTLSVAYGVSRQITLSGSLIDHPNPSLQTINVSGKATGTTMTNMQGQFSVTLEATGLGTVIAAVMDSSTTPVSVTLTDAPLSLTFDAVEATGHVWTLQGQINYSQRPPALIVYFGGSPTSLQMMTTGATSSGHYELGVMLNGTPSDNGIAWAKVVSPWGTESPLALDSITQT